MLTILLIAGVSLASFLSTNLDNLLLLIAFVAASPDRTRPIAAGYLVAVIAVLAVGFVGAQVADLAPTRYAGLLGVIPLAMGTYGLYRVVRPRRQDTLEPDSDPGSGTRALSVAVVSFSNSADSVAVFVPLFAETPEPLTFVIMATVIVAAGLWAALAALLARHRHIGPHIARMGERLVPLVLIGVGLYILTDTPTDTLLPR